MSGCPSFKKFCVCGQDCRTTQVATRSASISAISDKPTDGRTISKPKAHKPVPSQVVDESVSRTAGWNRRRKVLPAMTDEEVARAVAEFRALGGEVKRLPTGYAYGYVPISSKGGFL